MLATVLMIVLITTASKRYYNSENRECIQMRIFLITYLIQYDYTDGKTRIMLVTYDRNFTVQLNLTDNNSWEIIERKLTVELQYGPASDRSVERNMKP